jgi:hypothetical protein
MIFIFDKELNRCKINNNYHFYIQGYKLLEKGGRYFVPIYQFADNFKVESIYGCY